MNAVDIANQITGVIQALLPALERLVTIARKLGIRLAAGAPVSYENLSLSLVLDLRDPTGKRAVITRRQVVRFLVPDVGVIAAPIWGDGQQAKRYVLSGAHRLGWRPEGPRRVVLLGLRHRPGRDERASITAKRTVADGFTRCDEYFETMMERPTRRLSLRVVFPKARPPVDTYILATPGQNRERVPIRVGRDGRTRASWSLAWPKPQTIYSLRWSW